MANNVAEIILKLNDKVSKGLGIINNELENTVKKLEKVEQQARTFEKLRTGALLAGGAIAVSLGLATHKAVQFESSLAPVKTVLSGTASEVEQASARIGKSALAWSSQYEHSSEQYLSASYNLLSAGLNETQAIAGTNQALKLATATLGDATTASALLGTLYNNFGNKANDANKEMTKLSDTVAKTQQLFQIANLGQLNEGLKYAAASSQAFNISFDQTSAVVGQLNTLGITGSMAGTSFNAMMTKLNEGSEKLGYTVSKTANGGIDLIKTLENISNLNLDADIINKTFGSEGAKGIVLLSSKIGDLKKNYDSILNSNGATEIAFKKMTNTATSQGRVLRNIFNNIGIGIGNVFLPALNGILRILIPLLGGFSNLVNTNKVFARVVAILGVALAGILLAFGSYVFWVKTATLFTGFWTTALKFSSIVSMIATKSFWALNTAILANPIGAVIAVAIGVLAVLLLNIDKVVAWWNNLTNTMQGSNIVLRSLWNVFDFFIGNTLRGLKWLVDGFKKFMGLLGKKSAVNIETPNIDKLPELEQKITPKLQVPKLNKLTKGLGNEENIPLSHLNFLQTNDLDTSRFGRYMRTATPKVNRIKNLQNNKNTTTVIHIDKVEIGEGTITDLEDFVFQLKNKVAVS